MPSVRAGISHGPSVGAAPSAPPGIPCIVSRSRLFLPPVSSPNISAPHQQNVPKNGKKSIHVGVKKYNYCFVKIMQIFRIFRVKYYVLFYLRRKKIKKMAVIFFIY